MSESKNDPENLQEWGLERFLTSEELNNCSWEERMEYEDKLKRYRDWHNIIAYAREQGMRRCIEKGRKEVRISAAKILKEEGKTVDFIEEITDLSKEEIENL